MILELDSDGQISRITKEYPSSDNRIVPTNVEATREFEEIVFSNNAVVICHRDNATLASRQSRVARTSEPGSNFIDQTDIKWLACSP